VSVKTLSEFLKDKSREMSQDERRKLRDEWSSAIDQLTAQLHNWLKEADTDGILDVVPELIEKREEGLGAYKVRSLEVRLGGATVRVVPVGRNVVGFIGPRGDVGVRAQGRVDITDGVRKYILYRTVEDGQDRWWALDDRYQASALDRGRFEAIMQDLLS
jgi:hypothetical protein